MKHTAEDFKDILAGSIDKVDTVNRLKIILLENGLHCKITRRKTATGRKIYFHINRINPDKSYVGSWWFVSENVIQIYFPKAHLISGNSDRWVIVEY